MPTGRSADAVRLLVEVAMIDCWDDELAVGVEREVDPAIPEIKIARIATKKLTINRIMMIDLFF